MLGRVEVHLDTDFAGDTDDAAALAMLLGWPGVDVIAVTTTADPDGARARYVLSMLDMARLTIPVAAGAAASLDGRSMGALPDHRTYWGDIPLPDRGGLARSHARDLISGSIDRGATVIAIGPYTNLAELEAAEPGTLARARVVVMGGWIEPPAPGLPEWGPERDWNVQADTRAAVHVFDAAGELVLATLPGTIGAHLRASHLPRLERSGPIGRLLARQARAHGNDHDMHRLGQAHAALPDDLLNFHWDPVACAVAVGWPGVTVDEAAFEPVFDGDVLRFARAATGKRADAVIDVDGPAFAEAWLTAIERVDRR